MAPNGNVAQAKRKPTENQFLFDLGVKGRKTGITLPDTGIRDENGLEPMDGLFSSPMKARGKTPQVNGFSNRTVESEDMDVADTLNDVSTDMDRSEDYSEQVEDSGLEANVDLDESLQMVDTGNGYEPEFEAEVEEEEEPEPEPEMESEPEPEPQEVATKKGKRKATEPEVSEQPAKKARGRPKRVDAIVAEEEERPAKRTRRSLDKAPSSEPKPLPKKKMGRPKKIIEEEPEPEPEPEPEEEHVKKVKGRLKKKPEPEEAPTKKVPKQAQKTKKTAQEAKPSKTAPKKSVLAAMEEFDSPQVKRGPPLPRNNRGLVILRRETPAEGHGFKQTRSGRNSIKPVAYWKNERIEYDPEENDNQFGKFLLPSIKEVIRADEPEESHRKRSKPTHRAKSKSKKPRRTADADSESDEDVSLAEPWETNPGTFLGEIRQWDPADPQGLMAQEIEEEIAISATAIVTHPVKQATFKFAKTLTLPFFGSGMVDLPPGALKKQKNSRSMQLVFFVHFGRVKVVVNETEFRIGKGGMWQVPRGNSYSIENDYDFSARIFFSQGCEINERADNEISVMQ
ncbi:putative Centromere protein 3 [Glarea lozoyensis 74030]|uniref:CENP-C homolog n=1 Tax=Glarea lozoyensis (strain ATCC 74030 / MF5533) TaxID=1104152 RepID=H0ERS7_GLAL7|nr:putative Centromere protein 3 [Glarea lozoyensis 74030]